MNAMAETKILKNTEMQSARFHGDIIGLLYDPFPFLWDESCKEQSRQVVSDLTS